MKYKLNDYIGLNDEQKKRYYPIIDLIIVEFEKNGVTVFDHHIRQTQKIIKSKSHLSLEMHKVISNDIKNVTITSLNTFLEQFTHFVFNLSKHQKKILFENMQENFEDNIEELNEVSEQEYLEDKIENNIDQLEDWVGNLSQQQQKIVTNYHQENPSKTFEINRKTLSFEHTKTILTKINQFKEKQELSEYLFKLNNNRHLLQTQTSIAYYEQKQLRLVDLINQLIQSLSVKQTQELLEKLSELKNFINEL